MIHWFQDKFEIRYTLHGENPKFIDNYINIIIKMEYKNITCMTTDLET